MCFSLLGHFKRLVPDTVTILALKPSTQTSLLGCYDMAKGDAHPNSGSNGQPVGKSDIKFQNSKPAPSNTSEARSFRFFSSHCGRKLTFIPGDRASMPSPKPLRCTKTSSPPSEGAIKPKPFWSFQFLGWKTRPRREAKQILLPKIAIEHLHYTHSPVCKKPHSQRTWHLALSCHPGHCGTQGSRHVLCNVRVWQCKELLVRSQNKRQHQQFMEYETWKCYKKIVIYIIPYLNASRL